MSVGSIPYSSTIKTDEYDLDVIWSVRAHLCVRNIEFSTDDGASSSRIK
ncbi:hypothetical protein O9929_24330 [Vibrio lentus]|nr:hypothetical protein [Vibrio lentus]